MSQDNVVPGRLYRWLHPRYLGGGEAMVIAATCWTVVQFLRMGDAFGSFIYAQMAAIGRPTIWGVLLGLGAALWLVAVLLNRPVLRLTALLSLMPIWTFMGASWLIIFPQSVGTGLSFTVAGGILWSVGHLLYEEARRSPDG